MAANTQYTQLPARRSFRLLKILSTDTAGGCSGVNLECTLDTFQLDEHCPEYVALSYTWGSPYDDPEHNEKYGVEQSKIISVSHDGRPAETHRIGRSLYDALIQTHKTKWQSYLWADAVCINQEDKDESASQVQLMGDIYSKPAFVVAWIGPEPCKAADIAWWYGPFIEYFAQYALQCPQARSIQDILPRTSANDDVDLGEKVLVLHGSEITVSQSRILALCDWFNNARYFNRVWMLQELGLPKRVIYLFGSIEVEMDPDSAVDEHTLLWLWLGLNIEMIRGTVAHNTNNTLSLQMPPPPNSHTIWTLRGIIAALDAPVDKFREYRQKIYGASSVESDGFALLELLLARTGHLSATDVRDKIYGMFGMISRCAPHFADRVIVDYRLTMQDLLKKITIYLLTELPHMTCFALRPPICYPRLPGLPSWVIDITTTARGFQPGGISAFREVSYNAYPARYEANSAIEFDGDKLQLYGRVCGKIVTVMKGFAENLSAPGFIYDHSRLVIQSADLVRNCLQIVNDVGSNYMWVQGQPTLDAIVQTVTLSNGSEEFIGEQLDAKSFWIFAKYCLWRLVDVINADDIQWKATAETCLKDCAEKISTLAASGYTVPQSLLTYAQHIGVEKVSLYEVEDPGTLETENAVVLPLLNSTAMINRAFFHTEHGFFGASADDTKSGDELWILCRARVPHILRPLPDGTYMSLGEAYVHGGVDGELIEKGIAGPLQRINIV